MSFYWVCKLRQVQIILYSPFDSRVACGIMAIVVYFFRKQEASLQGLWYNLSYILRLWHACAKLPEHVIFNRRKHSTREAIWLKSMLNICCLISKSDFYENLPAHFSPRTFYSCLAYIYIFVTVHKGINNATQ